MKYLLSFVMILFCIGLVSGGFGFDNPDLPKLEAPELKVISFNNNTAFVNSSDWWDNLDFPNATQMENSNTELNIKESFLLGVCSVYNDSNNIFWNRTGTELSPKNAGDDIRTTGIIYADAIGTGLDVLHSATIGNFLSVGDDLTVSGAILGGGSGHDQFSDFVTNEHINWEVSGGAIEDFKTTGQVSSSGVDTEGLDVGSGSLTIDNSGTINSISDIIINANDKTLQFGSFQDGTIGHDGDSLNLVCNATTSTDDCEFTGSSHVFRGSEIPVATFLSSGASTRIRTDHVSNSGVGFYIAGALKYSMATFQADSGNYEYTLFNDQLSQSAFQVDGATNNIRFFANGQVDGSFQIGSTNNYVLSRNGSTGFLDFQGVQAGFTGYDFKSDDGSRLLTIFDNGSVNVIGNITSENVFIPQYMFAHTNKTIPVLGVGVWTNITFDQENTDVKFGISHIYNDNTNHTFTIMEDGIYNVDFDLDVEDTSPSASDIDVAGRLIYVNGN